MIYKIFRHLKDFIKFLSRSLTFDSDKNSCDKESLYTSIPTELGLKAIKYWIMRKQNLIPQCFPKEFILESIELILKNYTFLFDSKIFNNQIFGKTMRTKCALPYTCLATGYQEETKRSTQELPKYFLNEECLLIKEFFKRYMDDDFFSWPKYLEFNKF